MREPYVGGYRLATGGVIDRSRPLRFTFNGKPLSGYAGDSLASALIANGVNLITRSFKYHSPRGFYGTGLEDPNAIVSVEDGHGYDPAIRAGQVRLVEGLKACSLRGTPSTAFDIGAAAQGAAGLLGAGFYYKTFLWPNWKLFEPFIRAVTGFGRPRSGTDHRIVQHRRLTCDVLVIGAGPAGLLAARALRGTGLKVVIADDQPVFGGSLLWETVECEGQSAVEFSRKVVDELVCEPNVTVLPSTLITAAYENNVFTLLQTVHDDRGVRGECHWTLRAHQAVLATGMIDRPLLFEGNARPGILLSGAVRRLIGEFAVAPARRLAIYTNNDSAYLTAIKAHRAGLKVVAMIDTRPAAAAIHAPEIRTLDIPCHFESQIATTSGYRRLSRVTVRGPAQDAHHIACDGLAISGGWTPLIHLAAHRGVKPTYDPDRSVFHCPDLPQGWRAVGGANGATSLESLLEDVVGAAGAITSAYQSRLNVVLPRMEAASFGTVAPLWMPRYGSRNKMWVDLQNDVKVSDIELAARENYTSIEHLKRYTTLGMGTDQGRTSNVNGLAVLAALTAREIPAVGTTTFRPPYTSVRMATIANERRGNLYRPRRYLPADAVLRKRGAVMEDFGWERPDWYQSNDAERETAVAIEMRAVREHVGVFDGSSLGKIEVTGPDAPAFLARFYVSNMATLKPGRIRYSVMLREDGTIFDDGVVTCIAPNHFLASPTSGNAESIAQWFERWRQTEWPSIQVAITPVTANWASIAISGPKARDLLQRLTPDFDISSAAFGHMEFREGSLSGVRARVARISFTGELQYELTVPSRYGGALVEALLVEEGPLIPRAVGMEAWLRLRLEKGYLHVGSDTNGRTTPLDIGMGPLVAKRSDDFIGKRSLSLAFAQSREREHLVGLTTLQGSLTVGSRILAQGQTRVPCPTDGYVTSACFSPTLGRHIGLALLERGREREGDTVTLYNAGKITFCRVGNPVFYDVENHRLQA